MSKHIYWNVVFLFLIFTTQLFAYDQVKINKIIEDITLMYKHFENNQTLHDDIKKNFSHLNNPSDISLIAKKLQENTKRFDYFINAAKTIKDINPTIYNKVNSLIDNIKKEDPYKKYIFYFVSESMPSIALERFYASYSFLNKKYPDEIIAMAVYKGFPENFKDFYKRYKTKDIQGGEFKIHPFMYKYYNLDGVPAYAYAKCPRVFKFKDCVEHYLVRGDLSLQGALDIFSHEVDDLKKYYHYFIDAK